MSVQTDITPAVPFAGAYAGASHEPNVGDYIQLMKPRVMTLVILTALAAMIVAPGPIHPVIGAIAILAIAVGAGASGALTCGTTPTSTRAWRARRLVRCRAAACRPTRR